MTGRQQKTIENMASCNSYFAGHSMQTILFAREYTVSSQIQTLISGKTELTFVDFENIVTIFNRIEDSEHFDGSGWFDYKLRLSSFFRAFGYDLKWDTNNKKIVSFHSRK
ncbi:MAG: hypothetical protein JST26_15775 [Bacteroidetes bacterium]|nr:hypothetical protein [Bacteroidota bacterium]